MKITRRHALQGTGATALGLAGLNFDFSRATAQTNVKRGGTLNFAISAEAPHYDPHASDTYATLHLAATVLFDACCASTSTNSRRSKATWRSPGRWRPT